MDEDPCGSILEIDDEHVIGGDDLRKKIPGVVLVCSRPFNHTPRDQHSDGVTDWLGDEAP